MSKSVNLLYLAAACGRRQLQRGYALTADENVLTAFLQRAYSEDRTLVFSDKVRECLALIVCTEQNKFVVKRSDDHTCSLDFERLNTHGG